MILPHLGNLSTAQDLTSNSTTDSENVILMPASDWAAIVDCWWIVQTETIATGDAQDTYQFQLVLSQEAALDTNIQVVSRTVTGYASLCLATAGMSIVSLNIGKMLNEIMQTDLSDYPYLGMISTITTGATISINSAVTPVEPDTVIHSQVTVSNVGVPAKAS